MSGASTALHTFTGELLDSTSELPVMSFNVGSGQWFEFKLAGTTQVKEVVAGVP